MIQVLSKATLAALLKRLGDIRSERRAEEQALANSFGDLRGLVKFYVEPRIQSDPPKEEDAAEGTEKDNARAFEFINTFLSAETPRNRENLLLLLAGAGMGKTSLLVMLRLTYLHQFWPAGFEVQLLKISDQALEEIAAMKNKGNTVLLLDALDEDPKALDDVRERIDEIATATVAFRRVIVTCRTQYIPTGTKDPFERPGRIRLGKHVVGTVHLSYFNHKEVNEYLTKRFTDEEERRKAAEIVGQFHNLQFRPLLLSYIDAIMQSDRDTTEWTLYQIFDAVVNAWLIREEQKLSEEVDVTDVSHADLLSACQELAMQLNVRRTSVISDEDLQSLLNTHTKLQHVTLLTIGGKSLLNRNNDHSWKFAHFAIQEFLVVASLAADYRVASDEVVTVTEVMSKLLNNIKTAYRLSFSTVSLKSFRIEFCVFSESDFDLSAHDLDIISATLSNVQLTNAVTWGFTGCEFQKCRIDCSGFDLIRHVDIDGNSECFRTFAHCRFNNCEWVAKSFESGLFLNSKFTDIVFVGCDFSYQDLKQLYFANCTFKDCDFHGATLSHQTMSSCKFEENNQSIEPPAFVELPSSPESEIDTWGLEVEDDD